MKVLAKLTIIYFLFVASTLAFAAPMTEAEFAQVFTKQAKANMSGIDIQVVEPLQLNTKDSHGHECTVFLNNAYYQYKSSPRDLTSIIYSQLESLRSLYKSLPVEHHKSILPVIKPARYIETVREQLAKAGVSYKEIPFPYQRLNDDLYIFFVFDTEQGMRLVTKNDLLKQNIDEKSLLPFAKVNLASYFRDHELKVAPVSQARPAKIFTISLDQNYEASILLLDKFWNKASFDVEGGIVAFVPARNMVIVTGAKDVKGLRLGHYLSSKGFEELGYAISPKAFLYEYGNWIPMAP